MIYLDYAAATPLSEKAKKVMEPYFSELFFNPSAAYLPAKKVRADYEDAKSRIAHCIGAKGTDLVMTSGATEANNLAFTVVTKKCLVLETEHDSILNVAKNFNHELIKVDQTGTIILDDLKSKLTDDVELISISLANNEIGTIQPLAEVAEIIRATKFDRLKRGVKTPLCLHSDASQAANLIDIQVARLGVDLLTLNAAKVYGPKGVGALYVSHEVKLKPIAYGGGQELGLRSGTENVPGVLGFAVAMEDAKAHLNGNRRKYEELKNGFMEEINRVLSETIPQPAGEEEAARPREDGRRERRVEGSIRFISTRHQLSNFCPLIFPGIDAERLIFKLEDRGIYVSTGAACAASKGQKSKTLAAIGLSDEEINGSLRITFGKDTTEADLKIVAQTLAELVKEEHDRAN